MSEEPKKITGDDFSELLLNNKFRLGINKAPQAARI